MTYYPPRTLFANISFFIGHKTFWSVINWPLGSGSGSERKSGLRLRIRKKSLWMNNTGAVSHFVPGKKQNAGEVDSDAYPGCKACSWAESAPSASCACWWERRARRQSWCRRAWCRIWCRPAWCCSRRACPPRSWWPHAARESPDRPTWWTEPAAKQTSSLCNQHFVDKLLRKGKAIIREFKEIEEMEL